MLKEIKLKILIDSLNVRNSNIEYEEFNDKTRRYAKVKFAQIKGEITGISNYNLTASDSLLFNLYICLWMQLI